MGFGRYCVTVALSAYPLTINGAVMLARMQRRTLAVTASQVAAENKDTLDHFECSFGRFVLVLLWLEFARPTAAPCVIRPSPSEDATGKMLAPSQRLRQCVGSFLVVPVLRVAPH